VRSIVHLAESDPDLARAMGALLESHGHRVETYRNAGNFLGGAVLNEGCILLDLALPDMRGDALLEELGRRGVSLPVVALAAADDPAAAVRAMKLGALDCLEKPVAEEEVLAAVDRALDSWREDCDRHRLRAGAQARIARLSPREHQILQGLVGGLSNKSIARLLGLSPRTVEMHRANMMDDLGLDNLPEALRLAIDAGLAPLDEAGEEDGPAAPAPPPSRARRAGEAERRHDEKLKLVLEASGDGAWEWILPSSEIRLSTRLVERFGYRLEDTPDRFDALEDFVHPDDWMRFRTAIFDHLEGRSGAFAIEFRIRRADGGWAWIFDFGSIVDRDPETGAPLRMAGSISDITARKEEEQRAREAAELLELALWGAGAGVWELDLETRIIRLCRRSRELFGLPLHGTGLMGYDDWAATLHPDDLDAADAALERSIATGAPVAAEYRVLHLNGRTVRIRGLGKVIADGNGRPRRIVGLHQEVAAGSGTLDLGSG
jgi:two-component system response regulator FixJ